MVLRHFFLRLQTTLNIFMGIAIRTLLVSLLDLDLERSILFCLFRCLFGVFRANRGLVRNGTIWERADWLLNLFCLCRFIFCLCLGSYCLEMNWKLFLLNWQKIWILGFIFIFVWLLLNFLSLQLSKPDSLGFDLVPNSLTDRRILLNLNFVLLLIWRSLNLSLMFLHRCFDWGHFGINLSPALGSNGLCLLHVLFLKFF